MKRFEYRSYIRKYMKERREKDKGFAEKVRQNVRNYLKKIAERNSKIKAEKVRCVYCGYVWKTRKGVVPKMCPKCLRILVKFEVVKD